MSSDEQKPSDRNNFLTNLLSNGDSTVKLVTLVAVLISGGGNFFATKQAERITDKDAQRAVDQINDLSRHLDTTIDRQREMYDMLKKLTEQKKDNPDR